MILLLLIVCCCSLVMAAERVRQFACFSDYDKELVCHWEVTAQTNCSREFLLYYSQELFPQM